MKSSRILSLVLGVAMGLEALPRTVSAEQPDKWVSYVESAGTSWVDTGIIGRWNTKIEAKVEWMNLADSAFVASRTGNGDTRCYMCYCGDANGNMLLSQSTNANIRLVNKDWYARFEKNRVYNYAASFSATNSEGKSTGTVMVDGLGPWSTTFTGLNTGRSLYVFANNNGNGTAGKSKTRCYGLKIWQGPEDGGDMVLVRDFQPCMKGGKAGLYDAVSGDIFYSISGTDLICDENSEVPDEFIDYVESQGVAAEKDGQIPAYIDTGIIGKSDTTIEFKETCLCNDNDEHCVIGARNTSNNRFFMWYHASGHHIGLGYGDTYWRPVTTDPTKAGEWNDSNLYLLNYGDTTHARVSFAAGSQTCTVINDETEAEKVWTTLSKANAVDTDRSLYVFARNDNGAPNAYSASRLYFLKIWQDGVLVRDFRPCLKNGVAGLYDDVSKRIFYSLGTPLAFNNVHWQSVKPKEVVFVEYIESDGNNTLDTGVRARSGTRAKGEMAWTQSGDDNDGKMRRWQHEVNRYLERTWKPNVFNREWRAYLAAESLLTTNRFFMVHEMEGALIFAYGKSGNSYITDGGANIKPDVGTKYSFDISFDDGSQTFEWDGSEVLSTNIAGTVDTGNNLCLFSSSHWRNRAAARCYGLQIWQDDVLVRDFKPCLVDGRGMLYDEVTKSIYRPSPDIPASRVGKIILSGEEKPVCYVDYVETDGKQFIDTGIIGKAATIAEFKETSLQKRSDVEECFLGSYGGSSDSVSRFYMWYHAWGATAGIGYGVYWRPKNNDPYTVAADSSDPDVYKLPKNTTTHARVSFAVGAQTFTAIDDAGTETLYSSRTLSDNVDTGRNLYLFAKNDSNAGTPVSPAASRFYFLKISQGNADGSNMQLVRNYRPVKLSNGLVVLWDFANNEPYVAKSTTSPYNYTVFPVVGPDGEKIDAPFMLIVR